MLLKPPVDPPNQTSNTDLSGGFVSSSIFRTRKVFGRLDDGFSESERITEDDQGRTTEDGQNREVG